MTLGSLGTFAKRRLPFEFEFRDRPLGLPAQES